MGSIAKDREMSTHAYAPSGRGTIYLTTTTQLLSVCRSSPFFNRTLQVWLAQRFPKELLLIADARFLRVGIPSSHSTNSVKTLNGPQ